MKTNKKTTDRHSRDYYIKYAMKHPFWCRAHWYLDKESLIMLRENKNNVNIYLNID